MEKLIHTFPPQHEHEAGHGHDDQAHHDPGFWRTYIFSTDHKVIGIQYGLGALSFMLFGFFLMLLMRWQMAHPGEPVPVVGWLLEKTLGQVAAGGALSADLYNSFGAMHGTIMVFLGVVPLAFAAFGNYVVPLMIGAPDMAFPAREHGELPVLRARRHRDAGELFHSRRRGAGGLDLLFAAGDLHSHGRANVLDHRHGADHHVVAAQRGEFHRHHHSIARAGHDVDAAAVFCLGAVRDGVPAAAGVSAAGSRGRHAIDGQGGAHELLPADGTGGGGQLANVSGGGSPLLWQHLFWFLGHPEVYVLILPAMGIVCEIIANNTRKPIWGYKSLVYSALVVGFLSFLVWAHHMYLTGMGQKIATFFQATTMIISIPSVIILTCLLISLWGGSIRFNTPMLFALGFLPMFGMGGLTGLPLGLAPSDIHLHDTYYVIAHFHYVVAPGTIFALFAGIYYWFPKMTGRMMNEFWGRVHFWCSFVFMNIVFHADVRAGHQGHAAAHGRRRRELFRRARARGD
jgi:cytochrome c oxidase subunit 1